MLHLHARAVSFLNEWFQSNNTGLGFLQLHLRFIISSCVLTQMTYKERELLIIQMSKSTKYLKNVYSCGIN